MSALHAIADWPVTNAAAAAVGPAAVLAEYGDQQRGVRAPVGRQAARRPRRAHRRRGRRGRARHARGPTRLDRFATCWRASGLSMHTGEALAEPDKRRQQLAG